MKLSVKLLIAAMFVFYIQSYSQQNTDVNQIINNVNIDSLMLTVKELSGEVSTNIQGSTVTITSRYAYEQGNVYAANYIMQKLKNYGYNVVTQDSGTCRNIYANLTGLVEPQKKYIICAHYDSYSAGIKSLAPGADDNASGTSVVLEAARIFKKYSPRYTIVFVLFDEEEVGLLGSRYYANNETGNILGAINLDMVAYDSNDDFKVDLHVRNVANSGVLANAVNEVNNVYSIGNVINVVNPGTQYSDQYRFWVKGYSAIGLLEDGSDFSVVYHKATDKINKFNNDYFHKCAKLGIGTLASVTLQNNSANNIAIEKIADTDFKLDQNYPNPFNPTTTILYQIPKQSKVVIRVIDMLGREIETLVNKEKTVGNYSVMFDGSNITSGVYFYQLITNEKTITKKFVLMK